MRKELRQYRVAPPQGFQLDTDDTQSDVKPPSGFTLDVVPTPKKKEPTVGEIAGLASKDLSKENTTSKLNSGVSQVNKNALAALSQSLNKGQNSKSALASVVLKNAQNGNTLTAVRKLTDKEITNEASKRLSDKNNQVLLNGDDPYGNLNNAIQNSKQNLVDVNNLSQPSVHTENEQKVHDRMSEMLQQNAFSTSQDASNFLFNEVKKSTGKEIPINDLNIQDVEKIVPQNLSTKLAIQKVANNRFINSIMNDSKTFGDFIENYKNNSNKFLHLDKNDETQQSLAYQQILSDPDVIEAAKQNPEKWKQYLQETHNFNNKFPELAKQNLASRISQYAEDNGMNNKIFNNRSKKSWDAIVDKMYQKGEITAEDKAFYNQNIGADDLKTTGFLESLGRGYEEGIRQIGNTIGLEDLGLLADQSHNAQVNPTKNKILGGGGHLMGNIVPMLLTGGALKGVGFGEKAANGFAAMLQFGGGNAEQAKKYYPNDPIGQFAYTTLGTTIDTMLMDLPMRAQSGIKQLLSGEVKALTSKLSDNAIGDAIKEQAKQSFIKKATSAFGRYGIDILKHNAQTAGVLTSIDLLHRGLNLASGDKEAFKDADVAQSMIDNFMMATPLSAMSALGAFTSAQKSELGKAINELPDGTYTSALKEALRTKDAETLDVYLKNIAEQLNSSESEANTTRKVFGDKISDIALKLYPDARPEGTITDIGRSEENTPIREEGVDSKLDNGVEVDNSRSGEGVGDETVGNKINEDVVRSEHSMEKQTASDIENKLRQLHKEGRDIIKEIMFDVIDEKDALNSYVYDLRRDIRTYNNPNRPKMPTIKKWEDQVARIEKGEHTPQELNDAKKAALAKYLIGKDTRSSMKKGEEYNQYKAIAEDYINAKENGNNSKLVESVEKALRQSNTPSDIKPTQTNNTIPDKVEDVVSPKENEKVTNETSQLIENQGEPPISEPPKGTRIYVKRPEAELSHRGLQVVANEFSLPDVKTRDRKSDLQLRKDAEDTMNDWMDKGEYSKKVEGLVSKAEEGDILNDKERVILEQHLANLSGELRDIPKNTPEFDAKLAEIKRLKDAGEKTRSEAGAALRIPTFGSEERDLTDYYVRELEANKNAPLTEKQKETVEKEYTEISETEKAYQDKIAQLQAENAKLKAEQEISKTKSSTPKSKKAHSDFVKERQDIIKKMREDLLKSAKGEGGFTSSIPGAAQLKAIAPAVAKLMKSYVEEGVIEFEKIVKKLHDDVKEIIPEVTEKDIQDIVAGEYNEKKKTRNQLAEQLFNLRLQAKLQNKLEAILMGEEPKSERKRIQRNQAIEELRQKIKDLQKEKAEAEKQPKEPKEKRSPEEVALQTIKTRTKTEIEKIEQQLKSGDFSEPEKKEPLKLDKEALELRDKLIRLKQNREARILLQKRQNETLAKRGGRLFVEALNIPRTLMTIGDYSGLLRQGLLVAVGHPVMTAKNLPAMFKAGFSQKYYDRWFADLKENPRYQVYRDAKLAIADSLTHDLSEREEAFMSSLAEKIPIIGQTLKTRVAGKEIKIPGTNLVKGSERNYTMLLNRMRVDLFDYFANQLEARGVTYQNSPKVYKAVAEYVNNVTGRSDFGKHLNRISPILNAIFFSPKLIASRVNMLTYFAQPRFWRTVPKEVRVDYFRNWGSLLATGALILALAKLNGAQVEDDPRSSDFGKIRDGNTRWDIWGGFQPYIRTFAQVSSGARKSTRTGKVYELNGDDIFGETRANVVTDFLRNKLAPVPGMLIDILSERTGTGDKIVYQWGGAGNKEVSIDRYIKERMLPMIVTGTQEAIKDQGYKAIGTVGVPSIFGIGTQTYDLQAAARNKKAKAKHTKKSNKK